MEQVALLCAVVYASTIYISQRGAALLPYRPILLLREILLMGIYGLPRAAVLYTDDAIVPILREA